ncbi:type II toxin-antitoxin system VapC family toxin [Bradyrhizobium sp. 190]|uniref:type II toxin-antitoxin system VapC family toxin n=1 Tax=Bradyrhizobium sp. 190 TaxID=2782658 RepID=UPI001FF70C30|nr:type II toxin-antitoxin system VapC family toxin [Bradyrhizobium sp. 190]MCK1518679.1 type II toxin-antitoxin system VapC family toxin [Bradyrhizobium sp. 190]
MTLVDSNVLLDIFTQTPGWWEWSLAQLEDAALQGPLLINDVIFAETSIRFPKIEDFEKALSDAGITVVPIPRMALFLAGKASVQYRNAGGARSSVLPDFFIGAHAAVEQLPLLTRDTRRYRTYFPAVTLIAPEASA